MNKELANLIRKLSDSFGPTGCEDEVKKAVEEKVPEYMVPGKIVKLDVLPMNANDKIDRVLLKEQYG